MPEGIPLVNLKAAKCFRDCSDVLARERAVFGYLLYGELWKTKYQNVKGGLRGEEEKK